MRTALKAALGLILVLIILDGILILRGPRIVKSIPHKLGPIVRLVDRDSTFCTGTVISPDTILTAAHCVLLTGIFGESEGVRKNIEIRPSTNDEVGAHGDVTAVRHQMDQAVITGDFSKFDNLEYIPDVGILDSSKVKSGKLTACGYPLGGPLFCTAIYFKSMYNFMWRVHGTLIPGMSGGPVLLSNDTVVGTNVAVEGPDSIVSPIYNLDMQADQE